MLFVVSGVLPMIVALILAIALPESPQYLLARGADTAKVAKSVRILDETAAAFGVFVDRRDAGVVRLANRDSDHRRRGDRRCRGPGVDAVID